MNTRKASFEEQVDPSAASTFRELLDAIQANLLDEARKTCPQGLLKEEDLVGAYQRLDFPSTEVRELRDAQAIVSQALRENRVVEWVSYGMAIILFGFGLTLLAAGVLKEDIATRTGCLVAGSIVELLILIPFRFAINSRRHNIGLRMLGVLLARVKDPKKLAPLLRETFLSIVVGQRDLPDSGEK